MIKAAHVDPEIIEIGIHVAGAIPESKIMIGWSGEELQREADAVRRWSSAEREISAVLSGISGALLTRKHRLGQAILDLYAILRRRMNHQDSRWANLRPHLEEMQRAFARQRKGRRGTSRPSGDP